jgi:hypothetical protein
MRESVASSGVAAPLVSFVSDGTLRTFDDFSLVVAAGSVQLIIPQYVRSTVTHLSHMYTCVSGICSSTPRPHRRPRRPPLRRRRQHRRLDPRLCVCVLVIVVTCVGV